MKKNWETPELEILSIDMTMAGPGLRWVDDYQNDPDIEDNDHFS
ncbi:paeninodin family lasso peptide [Bacillus spongiae]|uniref:Paeninodin family lasso peptide n=1 Tax=Bacillus spongiae TaxID=2683610 RepID=A0ABU8HEN8_9BACI